MSWTRRTLSGWGRYPRLDCDVAAPTRRSAVPGLYEEACGRQDEQESAGWIPYGLGRSYGDAPLLSNGAVLQTTGLARFQSFDEESGRLVCEAGVTLAEILEVFGARGFFSPVVPGTKFVTVGGAIANDIHGKNHHVDGTFTDHVEDFEMLCADGEVRTVSRSEHADLFHATVGGLGLTGTILSATVRLAHVGSPWLDVESIRVRDLDHFFEVSAESGGFSHVVTWIDCLARGKKLGRGIFTRGRHLPAATSGRSGLLSKLPLRVPVDLPNWLLNPLTAKVFNEAYFRKQWRARSRGVVHYEPWFFPLDAIHQWNRGYGKRGMLQYQLVVPPDPEHRALRRVVEHVARSGMGTFLAVIKEFGDRDHGGLSFPREGVTLALDFPNYGRALLDLLDELDRMVVEAGGRVYLGKDARLGAEMFRAMYPEWREWKEVRDRWDPDGRFVSSLGRRVGLVSGVQAQVNGEDHSGQAA